MTIPELKAAFIATMQSYMTALDKYTDEQFAAKPSADEWSLGQMYEHLYGANTYFFLANMKRCLEQRKGQVGGEMNDNGRNIFKHNSLPPAKFKVPAPGGRAPDPVAQERAAYKSLFQETLQDGLKLAEVLPDDPGLYKTLHPVLGWLNAKEWFQSTETHARHHFRQQQEREEWLGIENQEN